MKICAVAAVAAHRVLAWVCGAVCGGAMLGEDAVFAIVGGAFGAVAEDVVG